MKKTFCLFGIVLSMFCCLILAPQGVSAAEQVGTVTISVEKFTLGQGYLMEPVIVPLEEGDSAADVTLRILGKENCKYDAGSFYLRHIKDNCTEDPKFPQYILQELAYQGLSAADLVEAGRENISWLGEFDYHNTSGWCVTVNNGFIDRSAGDWPVKDGDVIRWQFTMIGYGGDLGDTRYGDIIVTANKDALTKKIAEINKDKATYIGGDVTKQRYFDNAMIILTTMTATQEQVDMALANLNGTSAEEPTMPDPDYVPVDEEVESVKELIEAIGEVTMDSKAMIDKARAAYEDLTAKQAFFVTNYDVLKDAEAAYTALLEAAVNSVEEQIAAIGEVTLDSKDAIDNARIAYNKLSAELREQVENYDVLIAAETAYASLLSQQRPGADTMKDMTDKSAWYFDEVDWAMKEGFFNGDANGNFNPGKNITRAEFAQMLYNYYKDDAAVMKNGNAPKLNDVKSGAWYYEAVMACAKAGIFLGDTNGNFNPNAQITRQDASLVLMRIFIGADAINATNVDARLAELNAQGKVFPDFYETASYARKAMAAAAGFIFNGDQKGELNPTSNITRAETATVLYNYFN